MTTRWTPQQAKQVVEEYERSGLTLTQFAKNRDLHPKRIRVWQRRFEQTTSAEPPRMVELVPTAPEAVVPPPVRAGSLKLCCPSGYVIELGGVELTVGIRVLLEALPGATTC